MFQWFAINAALPTCVDEVSIIPSTRTWEGGEEEEIEGERRVRERRGREGGRKEGERWRGGKEGEMEREREKGEREVRE